MRSYHIIFLSSMLLNSCSESFDTNDENVTPPEAEKIPVELINHGDTRVDNYYWMKERDNPKVKSYLEQENGYLNKIMVHTEALQQELYDELTGRLKQDDESAPYKQNGYYYYTRYEESKEYPIYCRKKGDLEAEEEIMLNVNEMSEGYDYFNVARLSVSPDNKWLAYGVDTVSRRLYTIHFKNLETGELLPDKLPNTSADPTWANDNKTVFYTTKNTETLLSEKIYKHKINTDVSEDELIYEEKDNTYYIGVNKSKSGRFIVIWNGATKTNDYWLIDADNPDVPLKNFTPRTEGMEYNIDHVNGRFYIITNWNATNFRLMETGEANTGRDNWKEVIAEREDVLLRDMEVFKNHLVLNERKNGLIHLRIMHFGTGDEHYMDFGEEAYFAFPTSNYEMDTEELRYYYSSLTTPYSIIDYNMITKEKELKKQQEVVGGHNPDDYVVQRVYAPSRDGVEIPITVAYKKGFEKNGQNPMLLYGYGSYGATIDPSFRMSWLSLYDRGFAVAIAHIRGGQINGRKWYEDGKMFNKKNTFYDFIDCAEYLIDEGYTIQDKLFGQGASAGGLLIGAVSNLRPDLFKGLIAGVPFVDVITTMSDASIPLTTNEYDEWGNPNELESYEYIKSYSPYDNVKEQAYANMLVITGFHDSQVQYWEPAKWVAKLRVYNTGNNVILLQTEMEAGHGGASGRFRRYRRTALEYAFMIDLKDEGKYVE